MTGNRKKSRKNLLMRLVLPVLAIYAVVVLVDMQITLAQRRQELDTLQVHYEQLRLDNKDLERQLSAGADEEYLESEARKLDYVAPDETVFIDISGS